jgi:apolipoprotein N-acyltransferase
MIVFLFALVRLSNVRSGRFAGRVGLLLGFLLYGPQLKFFWNIFGPAAIALWLVLAVWIAAFLFTLHQCRKHIGLRAAMLLAPVLWMGFEFFRSELYYLRFSWLNVGYAFSHQPLLLSLFGVYGIGFVLMALASVTDSLPRRAALPLLHAWAGILALIAPMTAMRHGIESPASGQVIRVAAVQLEFPAETQIVPALEQLRRDHPDTDLFVLSEYTFAGPVPPHVTDWCRQHQKHLIAGGKDERPDHTFFNTAFVIGTNGDVVFQQAKSVPIQFFNDGRPAPDQKLWHSPWGDLGLCICYDLSYTRVTDALIRAGAQALVVPTMDVVEWGEHQHRLHARVAPTRAAEYGLPLLRVASSGISQLVRPDAVVAAQTPFARQGARIVGELPLVQRARLPWDRLPARAAVAITGTVLVWLLTGALLRWSGQKTRTTSR